ncbi:MAG: hypothetical protein QOG94_3539 [Solirubrobacteraceae bacterium]|jgi:hypothetical protein|nr:hypothetical protein [Solirubrobacteraceae bacterium]
MTFTYSSPASPWSATELQTLESWTADGSPVRTALTAVSGPPQHDLTINISRDPAIGVAGSWSAGSIVLYDLELGVLLHELNHATRDGYTLRSRVWEEGLARAGELEAMRALAAQGVVAPDYPMHDHSYPIDQFYDITNVPDIGAAGGDIYRNPSLQLSRYQLAGYAFGKALIENAAFLQRFDATLFAQADGNLPPSTLVDMASSAQPSVEGVAFAAWYGAQGIFTDQPPTGCRLYQRASQFTLDFFCRDAATGEEVPQSGAPVTFKVYGSSGQLLYSGQDTTAPAPYDWAAFYPALDGYSGRLQMVASATSASGSATSTYYRPSEDELQGVAGVVTDAATGTVTFHSLSGAFADLAVTVVNGAFAAPSLAFQRGSMTATYAGPGATRTRQFTKDASAYALQLRPPAPTSFAVGVTKAGTGSGTVTSQPAGIDCGATCSASLPAGASVTLTAAPASGSTFAGWGGACTTTATTCVVSVNANVAVTASFAAPATGNLVGNPSFETSSAGWGSYHGTLSRVATTGAPDGGWVARAKRATGTYYSVGDAGGTAPTVPSVTAGTTYVASCYVRAAGAQSNGRPGRIVLRERAGSSGTVARETAASFTLGTTFKRVSVAAVAVKTGNTLGLRCEQTSAVAGDAFDADLMTVARATTAAGNTTAGTVWTSGLANVKRASSMTLSTPRELVSLQAYLDGKAATTGSQPVRGVLYAGTASGPTTRVATSSAVTISAKRAAGWVKLAFSTPVRLAAGTYWIGLHTGASHAVMRFAAQAAAGALRTNADSYDNGATTTFGSATTDGKSLSLYATGSWTP